MTNKTSDELRAAIEKRLGFFPPFLSQSADSPQVLDFLWNQTCVAYLDNPLPALFKEMLQVRLARYCAESYAIVYHTTSLARMGIKSSEILELLELHSPAGEGDLDSYLQVLEAENAAWTGWPVHPSAQEKALLLCAIFFFQKPGRSNRASQVVVRLLGSERYSQLLSLLAYIRSYHLLIEAHPGQPVEEVPQVWDGFLRTLQDEPRLARIFRNYREKTLDRSAAAPPDASRRDEVPQTAPELELRLKKSEEEVARAVEIVKAEVSKRKRTELELLATHQRIKELCATSSDLIITYDSSGKVTYLNKAAEEATGYTKDDISRMDLSHLLSQEHLSRIPEMLDPQRCTDTPIAFELGIQAKGNRTRTFPASRSLVSRYSKNPEFQIVARRVSDDAQKESVEKAGERQSNLDALPGLKEQVVELTRSNEALISEKMAIQHALKERIEESAAEEKRLQEQLGQITGHNEILRSQLEEREQSQTAIKAMLVASELESSRLRAKMEELHERIGIYERNSQALKESAATATQMREKLGGLESENARLQSALGEREQSETMLREALAGSEEESAKLRAEIEGLQSRVGEYEREIGSLKASATSAETQTQEKLGVLESENARLQSALSEREQSETMLREALAGSEEETAKLRGEIEGLQSRVGEYEREVGSLKVSATSAEIQMRQKLSVIEREKAILQSALSDREQSETAMRGALAASAEESAKLRGEIEVLQSRVAEYARETQVLNENSAAAEARLRRQLGELSRDKDVLRVSVEERDRSETELRQRLKASEEESARLRGELEAVQNRICAFERETEALRTTSFQAEESMHERISTLSKANRELLSRIIGYESERETSKQALAEFEARLAEASKSREDLASQLADHAARAAALREALGETEIHAAEASKTHGQLESQIAELREENESLRTSAAERDFESLRVQEEIKDLKARIGEYEREIQALNELSAEAESRYQEQSLELAKDNESLRLKVTESGQLEAGLRERLAQSEEVSAKLHEEIGGLKTRIGELGREIEMLHQVSAEAETSVRERIVELSSLNEDLLSRIARHEAETDDYRKELAEALRNRESLEAQIADHHGKRDALRKALRETEVRVDEALKAHEQLQNQMADLKGENESLRATAADREGESAVLCAKVEDLQTRIREVEQEAEARREGSADAESRLLEQLNALAGDNEVLRSRLLQKEIASVVSKESSGDPTAWENLLRKHHRQLALLSQMGNMLRACIDMDEAVAVIAQEIEQIFPAHAGTLYIMRPERGLVESAFQWGEAEVGKLSFAPDECFALRRSSVHAVRNAKAGLLCKHVGRNLPAGYICAPMVEGREILGVLHLSERARGQISESEQSLAVTVTEYIAMALSNLILRGKPRL